MNPATEPLLNFLLEKGTTAALMLAVLWILIKKVFSQYEVRIEALEDASRECQDDRKDLHGQIVRIQQEHIDALKTLK